MLCFRDWKKKLCPSKVVLINIKLKEKLKTKGMFGLSFRRITLKKKCFGGRFFKRMIFIWFKCFKSKFKRIIFVGIG